MMKETAEKKKGNKRGMFILLCIGVFIVSFAGSIIFKMSYTPPELRKYSVDWSDEIGTIYTDIAYGDAEILKWLCSKGYVAVGINYTLRDNAHPEASVYSQSVEIKEAMPVVVKEGAKLGYNIDKMAISGGSAGGCLALLYAYRDAATAPVSVKMVFEAVGPSSFYPEDWTSYGFDQDTDEARAAAAGLFTVMAGKEVTENIFGTKEYDEVIKDISALLWVNKNTVPTVMAYGKYDTFQPYLESVRLNDALEKNGIDHTYFVMEHSGHGLQNDNKVYAKYMNTVEEYLDKYITVENVFGIQTEVQKSRRNASDHFIF